MRPLRIRVIPGMTAMDLKRKSLKYGGTVWLALLLVMAVFLVIVSLCAGSVRISFTELFRALAAPDSGDTFSVILWKIRFPRALAGFIMGGALALSGYLMQTYFHNPIAGPYVLGVSSGAKLCVAAVMILMAGSVPGSPEGGGASDALQGAGVMIRRPGAFSLVAAAFVGALASMGFVLMLSGVFRSMSMLMVAGIMIGYICSAVTDLLVAFADDADIVSLHGWSKGSFSGMDWEGVALMAVITAVCLAAVIFLAKPISAYLMGEEYAVSLGVNVLGLRILLILIASLLAALVTAYAGPVSFVGIAVPQLIRTLTGEVKPLFRIPACFLGGGVFCLVSDLIARSLFAPAELSISTVTAVLGAPVVIWVLLKKRK